MQSDDKYIDMQDDFSEKIGEKLREHQMPVDSDVWESLMDEFPPKKRTFPIYLRWVSAGVAAVALLLLFLVGGGNEESEEKRELLRYAEVDKNDHTNSIIAPEDGNESVVQISEPSKAPAPESQKENLYQEEVLELVATVNPDIPLEVGKGVNPEESKEEVKGEEVEKFNYPEKISKQEEAIQLNTELLLVDELLAENHFSVSDADSHQHQSLMATMGSGEGISDFLTGDLNLNSPHDSDFDFGGYYGDGDDPFLGNNQNLLKPDKYTDVVHHLPVSVSLTVNFPIAENLGLETGLSYTYLSSRFSRNGKSVYRASLQQHYIGIPLNLRYTVWQNDIWSIYLLGGGSIEKGLCSIYKQETVYQGKIFHSSRVNSRIDGFQFSAQGGAGFSYRLWNSLSLFGEPRIVYYFENNQPMSTRTDSPLIFGLNLGIRIQFK